MEVFARSNPAAHATNPYAARAPLSARVAVDVATAMASLEIYSGVVFRSQGMGKNQSLWALLRRC
jgi:hypothetical protein